MRIARRIRRCVDDLELAGLDIIAADMGIAIAGIPDVSVRIDNLIVRSGAFAQLYPGHFTGGNIEAAEIGIALSDKPDGLPVQSIGVTRSPLPGHVPFLDVYGGKLTIVGRGFDAVGWPGLWLRYSGGGRCGGRRRLRCVAGG